MTIASSDYIKNARGSRIMVWYSDTDAIRMGEAVCYNSDYGTATDNDASRANRVEKPTVANSGEAGGFAGVAVRNYSAKTGGQYIEIWEPGSKSVPVALACDTVIGTGLLSFICRGRYNIAVSTGGANSGGRFYNGKFRGRGSAIPRETVTAALELETDGTGWSLATNGTTLTVADTTGMAAGDTVLFFGGEDDGTGTVIPGKYLISSVTDGTTLVLASSAVDVTPAGALTAIGVIYTGNPVAICDLLDGPEESHGIEFLNAPNAGSAAMPHKIRGLTYVQGGLTIAADVDVVLAQGTFPGDRSCYILLGAMTTNDFTINPATDGIQRNGSSALADVTGMDVEADAWYGVFNGGQWHTEDVVGGATEA